jgi:hypothetical protein
VGARGSRRTFPITAVQTTAAKPPQAHVFHHSRQNDPANGSLVIRITRPDRYGGTAAD